MGIHFPVFWGFPHTRWQLNLRRIQQQKTNIIARQFTIKNTALVSGVLASLTLASLSEA